MMDTKGTPKLTTEFRVALGATLDAKQFLGISAGSNLYYGIDALMKIEFETNVCRCAMLFLHARIPCQARTGAQDREALLPRPSRVLLC